MKNELRVALVQMEIADGDLDRNVAQAEQMVSRHASVQLYLLPELWTSGYVHAQWPALAKRTPDVLKALTGVARRQQAVIGGTLISENGSGGLSNRFWLVGTDGVLGCYDKAHLFAPMGEPAHLVPGNTRSRVPLASWTAALSICYDLRFPEMYRMDAVDGADLFLVPSEWPAERAGAMHALAMARAIENQSYLVLTNRVGVASDGTSFGGGSMIVAPDGTLIASAGAEPGVVTGTLEFDRIAAARGTLAHFARRRPGVDY
ncbi:MAG TPA: nitrilase-related carbon-nitrogen hydrolase [Gemmatimonadales bacterium]|nr:nitrilase-related carbon-nitrogen hydrolase [Gemmatimonadales bacterium]